MTSAEPVTAKIVGATGTNGGGRDATANGVAGPVPDAPARAAVGNTDADPVVLTGRRGLGARFWRLWAATGVSASGDGLVLVALPLLAFTLTRNPLAIAGVTASQRALGAFAALPAGVVADRFERRTVMVVCNVVSGLALLVLLAAMTLGVLDLAVVYVVAGVLAVGDVSYNLAMQASFPDVIASADQLGSANGRLMGADVAGESFLGPAIGGSLFAIARRLPFIADSASFFVAAVLVRTSVPSSKARLLHARGPKAEAKVQADGAPAVLSAPGGHGTGWRADFRAGMRLFRKQKALQLLAATMASVSFTQSIVIALLVIYGEKTLHLSSTGYGFFLAAASVLGIAGSFAGGWLQRRFGGARIILAGAATAAIGYLGMAFTHWALLGVLVFGLQEIGVGVANVGSVTTRQLLIPRQLYGRIGSFHRFIIVGVAPVGALFGGLIASISSVPRRVLRRRGTRGGHAGLSGAPVAAGPGPCHRPRRRAGRAPTLVPPELGTTERQHPR